MKLFKWQDCIDFDINQIRDLYKKYVNKSQANLLSSFGFGRAVATHAEGMCIYISDGRKILNFTSGMGVLNHGHNHPKILATRIEYQKQ